jgi:acyl-CoA synthetase (AMP-forming)/AMP-acid ligase II
VIRAWIEQAAASHGDDVYLADARGSATLTYSGLLDVVRETECRLDDAGLPPGSRVNVRLTDPLDYATALVALIAAGRVAVPLDPGAPDTDVARVLSVARPDRQPSHRRVRTVGGGCGRSHAPVRNHRI